MSIRTLSHQNYNGAAATPAVVFPTPYTTLINAYLGGKYYIDAVNGSDSNPGTELLPLRTYAGFRTLTSSVTTGVMAIFKAGSYTMSSILASTQAECCFTDEGYERIFVCQPGTVVFDWLANGGRRDANPFWFRSANSRVYGAIVKRNNNARTNTYSVSWFNETTNVCAGKIYNTVLQEIGSNGLWTMSYKNAGTWAGTQGPYYCTFANGNAGSSYSGSATFYGDRCAGNGTTGITSPNFTNYINAAGAMNTTTYYIDGASGVYQGLYAWPLPL